LVFRLHHFLQFGENHITVRIQKARFSLRPIAHTELITGLFWMTSDSLKAAMQNPSTNRHDVVSAPQYHTDAYAQHPGAGSPVKWILLGAALGVLGFGAVFGLYESRRAKAANIPAQEPELAANVQSVVADSKLPVEERPLVHVRLKDGQELLVDEVRHDEGRQETALVIHIAKADIAEVKQLALADEDDADPKAGDQVAQANQPPGPKAEEFNQPYIPRSGNTGHIGRHFVASDWVNDVAARQRRQQARLLNFLMPMRRFLLNYRNALKRAGMKVPQELDQIIGEEPKPAVPAPAAPPPPAVRPPAEAAPGPGPNPVQKPKSA
jgi:hypothetical protein